MLSFRRFRPGRSANANADEASSGSADTGAVRAGSHGAADILSIDGGLKFEVAQGGNSSLPSYQEVSGAPVELSSPLGYSVGGATVIFFNVGKMIGTGVYSTPATILTNLGSVGLSLIYWALGLLLSATSLAVYLEFASYFPNRSGAEVVYLEQAFPRPRYLMPVAFAVQTVILSFSSGNSIVLAEYLFATNGHSPTDWQLKGVAIAGYTVVALLATFHTRFSYTLANVVGVIKLLTLVFIAITGLVVLGGHSPVPDPMANFRDSFAGTKNSAYGTTNALVKIIFAYAGYENAFNVANEVKDPVKTIRRNGSIALLIVTILYVLANVAYFAAVPKKDIMTSGQTIAALFFQNVFGHQQAVKGFNFLIALSAFGNLLTVFIAQGRVIRECGRQGILPGPSFWTSTAPFNTPLGPYFVKWLITIIVIIIPPAGDAFNFIVDLQTYPAALFLFAMSAGLYIVRYRRKKLGTPPSGFYAWDSAVIFTILVNLYILVMPWVPPTGGQYAGDVSFWYATYCVVGIAIMLVCGIYYYAWLYAVPQFRGYRIRQEVLRLDNGAATHRMVKVPVSELEAWDALHDETGRVLEQDGVEKGKGFVEHAEVGGEREKGEKGGTVEVVV